MKRWYILGSIALSMLAFGGVAHSAVTSNSTVGSRMAACGRLPLSERGVCKQEVLNSNSSNGAQAMSMQDRDAIAASNAAFERSVATCNRLPLSERGICKVEPHSANAVAIPDAQRDEMNADNARYRARLASCARLPISERTTCASEAGRMTGSTSG